MGFYWWDFYSKAYVEQETPYIKYHYPDASEYKEEVLNNCIKNFKNSPPILYPSEDYSSPYICYKNDGESFVEKIRDAGVNKNKSSWNFENGSTITPLNDSESTVRSNRSKDQILRNIKIKKYRKDIDVKYSDEDFEKIFNYLLTPNEDNGIIPMDRLLNYLEDKKKYENSELKHWVDKVVDKHDSED